MSMVWLLVVFICFSIVKGDTRLLIDRDLIAKKDDLKFNFLNGDGSVRGRRFRTVGCWGDTWDRAIAPLEGRHDLLMDKNYKIREDPLRKCAVAALENNYGMFAIENGGQCMSDMTAEYYYKRYGRATGCRIDGYGGPWSMQVYSFSAQREGNGGYTTWSKWTSCSNTCGDGIQERVRTCTQPPPTKWGNNCDDLGPDVETRMCGHNDCDAPTIIQAVEIPTRHEQSQTLKAVKIDKADQASEKDNELEEGDMNDDFDDSESKQKKINNNTATFSKPGQTNLSKLLNGEGNMKQPNPQWSMINNDQMRRKGEVYGGVNGVQQVPSMDIKQAHRLLHKKWLALKNKHHLKHSRSHGVISGTTRHNVNKAFTAFDEDDMTVDDPDATEVNEATNKIVNDAASETGEKRAPQCVCPAIICLHPPTDSGVLIDNTNVTEMEDLEEMKSFAKGLAIGFGTKKKDVQMGIIAGGMRSNIVVPFGQSLPIKEFEDRVDNIQMEYEEQPGSLYKRAKAFLLIKQKQPLPPLLNDVLFVMESGDSDMDVHAPIKDLKDAGAKIVVIGVGKNAKIGKISSLADKQFTVPPGAGNALVNAIIAAVCQSDLMGKPMPNPKPCPCGFKKGTLPKENDDESDSKQQTKQKKKEADLTPLLSNVNDFKLPPAPATLQDGDDLSPEETTEDDDEEEEEGFENNEDDDENDNDIKNTTSATSSQPVVSTTKDTSLNTPMISAIPGSPPLTQSAALTPVPPVPTTAIINNNLQPAVNIQQHNTTHNGIPQQRTRPQKPVTNLLTNQPPLISQNKVNFANLDNKILPSKELPASNTMTVTISKLTPVEHGIDNVTSPPSLKANNVGLPHTNKVITDTALPQTTTMSQLTSKPSTTAELVNNFRKGTNPSITEQNLKSENNIQAQLVTLNNGDNIANNLKNKELISNNYDSELSSNRNTDQSHNERVPVVTKSTTVSTTNRVNNQPTVSKITSQPSTPVSTLGSPPPSNRVTNTQSAAGITPTDTDRGINNQPAVSKITSQPSTPASNQPMTLGSQPANNVATHTQPAAGITTIQTDKKMNNQPMKSTSQASHNGGVASQEMKPKNTQVSNNQPVNIQSIKLPSSGAPNQEQVPNKPPDNSKTSSLYKWLFTLSENLNKARQDGELKEGNFTMTNDIKNVLTTIEKTADQYRSEDYRKIIRKIGPTTPQVNITKQATKFKFNPHIAVNDASLKEKVNTTITNEVKNPVVSNFPTNNIITNQGKALAPATMIPDNVTQSTQSHTVENTQLKQPMHATQQVTTQDIKPAIAPNNVAQPPITKPNTVLSAQPTQTSGVVPGQKPAQTTENKVSDDPTRVHDIKPIKQAKLNPKSSIPKCDINLGFLLDGSASVEGSKRGNFLKMINFVKDIIHDFVKMSQPVHVGTVVYSTNTKVILGFGTKGTEEVVDRILDSVHYPGQGSMTGKALKDTYNLLFDKNVAPRMRKNVLLLLTDGPSNDDVDIPSRWIKQAGVEIFTIGLGNNYDSRQLDIIASEPRKHHVMTKTYDELRTSVQDIRYRLCGYNADQILRVMSSPYFTVNDEPTSKNGIAPNQCMVDVIFLLDGSRQVETNDNGNFKRQINFVKKSMYSLPVSRNDVHVGVGLLGDNNVMVFPMNEHYTEKSLQFELDHIRFPAGDLVQLQDLRRARDIMIHRGTRDIVPRVFVLLTDSSSMDFYHDAVQTLRNEGNDVILYGVSAMSWKQDIKTPSNVAGFDDQMLSLESENEEEAVKQFTINLCKISNAKRSDIPRTHWLATQTLVNNSP